MSKKSDIKKLDDKARSQCTSLGYCERCGASQELSWCHIKSRRYLCLRWEMANCLCLCDTCHKYFHKEQAIFDTWIESKFPGRNKYLNEVLNRGEKWGEFEIHKLV